ncbi:hydroxymethylglutaryl-CoA synthase family protein [Thalassovita taeanensis]|uniref:3-hydroxy-3-methylglutaryl CoA synthase n=1 Tax=Thalassovita taeanensis TaxID=657014 RepID=A0A1H9BXH6_9RHOB|nr:3-oxoacyl-[acyl-carrier-protein] synthase III C-terminal domain-containing protein [Thalassovita taeanensis]SEP93642.1 3-hydroxy-3-methylglutaryl CoA synthase [Thalassovita taeanensis]
MDFGITSFGAYVPRMRLERAAIAKAHKWMAPGLAGAAKGSRAFCSWDEDALTMAVEAGRDALGATRDGVNAIIVASTTLPYSDLSNAAIIAGALNIPQSAASSESTGSQRAATSALVQALEAGKDGTLVIGSDKPPSKPASAQEMSNGAGAAAVLLGTSNVVAKYIGSASVTVNFADHFRASDESHDYMWEERWIRDEGLAKIIPRAVNAALEKTGLSIGDFTYFVMPSMTRKAADSVAKKLGFGGKVADGLELDCGLAGAAHPLLMLANVLETAKKGERILLVGFGQGADAVVLEATGAGARPGRGVSGSLADKYMTDDYLRMASFYDEIELEWGMRAEKPGKAALTEAYRSSFQLSAFMAGKCPHCSTIQFPQLAYCVNPDCGKPADSFEQVSLADQPAKILTYTADWLSYYPAPPLFVGFVQFDNGARLLMETVDAPTNVVEVGVPVRMVFRIKERDKIRGYNRYFWKSTPLTV